MKLSNKSESNSSAFVKETNDSLWIFDENLCVLDCNNELLELRKETRKTIKNKPLVDILAEEENRGILSDYQAILETGKSFKKKYTRLSNEGNLRHIELKAYKLGLGIAIIEKDITDFFKIKEHEDILEAKASHYWDLLHHTRCVFFSQDKDLKYTRIINAKPKFDKNNVIGKKIERYSL